MDATTPISSRSGSVNPIELQCRCGAVGLSITGKPVAQTYCHCDDCQTVHAAAYVPAALYPSHAVAVTRGEPVSAVLRTTPRMRCPSCGAFLFAEIAGAGLRSLSGTLLPKGQFKPEFHVQCQHAILPVVDDLPHYKGFPAQFGGTDELVDW